MRKLIIHEHLSLDGFVAGPNGEMDWIKFDDAMFDFVGSMTDQADAALYGRVTYQMMDVYWPSAADKPDASKHDREHGEWYKRVHKVVLSQTMMHRQREKTQFIGEDIPEKILQLKKQEGKNILLFGSPGAARSLMEYRLIDEYWLFVNPVLLGRGIPLFSRNIHRTELKLLEINPFMCGVVGLHYVAD